MTEPFIRIADLKKHYQMGGTTVRALDGIDLEIMPHTFTVVMGSSGSGKSTLLYLLGGLDRATSGEIQVNGQSLNDVDENSLALFRRRTIGFVFQSFNLIPSMTAQQNVAFPMQFAGMNPSQRDVQANRLLDQVGLGDRSTHRPTELSGGQQQRVAIARALANGPPVIIADEPTGNLDSKTAESVFELFRNLVAQGKTIIIVTHDSGLAKRAHRTALIADGEIVNEYVAQAMPTLTQSQMLWATHNAKPQTYEPGAM